ncbi:MAG: hypothetical protein OXR73_02275 [Myxococcales bacterium]|nr:hypothetical protein [Myxococcales bacterium]
MPWSVAAHWAAQGAEQLSSTDRALLFAVSFVAFLVLPTLMLPRGLAAATFLILGWELTLKAYSYVVEPGSRRINLKGCLFYLLVDPTVVFPMRARPAARNVPSGASAGRFAAGMVCMALALAASHPIELGLAHLATSAAGGGLAMTMAQGVGRLLVAYGKQSGLASMQIGLMRLLGYDLQERFKYPLLSRDPADFWRRWNTYIGQWARRYLFSPLALMSARSEHRALQTVGTGCSVVAVFVAMGLYHDALTWFSARAFSFQGLALFGANGLLVVAWVGIARVVMRPSSEDGSRHGSAFRTGEFARRTTFAIIFLWLIGALT